MNKKERIVTCLEERKKERKKERKGNNEGNMSEEIESMKKRG